MSSRKDDFTCDIVESLGVLSTSKAGWTRELNGSWKFPAATSTTLPFPRCY